MKYYFKDSNTRPLAITIVALLIILVACLVWFVVSGDAQEKEQPRDYYALATVVCAIDKSDDRVTCEDSTGNLWDFYGVEDWHVGDNANLLMDGQHTESIYDDEICGATYGAWVLSK